MAAEPMTIYYYKSEFANIGDSKLCATAMAKYLDRLNGNDERETNWWSCALLDRQVQDINLAGFKAVPPRTGGNKRQ